MAAQELVEYIKRQLSHGHNVTTIREHLIKHNYAETIADEALHKATEEFEATVKHSKIPFKKIAYAFAALFIIAGIGFGILQMFGDEDLAGVATEAEPSIIITQQPKQESLHEEPAEELPEKIIEEQEHPEETIEEEFTEEPPSEAPEVIEETVEEQTPATDISTPECTKNDDCTSAYDCYQGVCEIDNDRDGLSDAEEFMYGTNPRLQDSDGDGHFDSIEVEGSTDPLDATVPGYITCSETEQCPENQACNQAGICVTCYDSDSENYKRKATSYGIHYVSGKTVFTQDACTDSGKLLEFYCTTDNYLYSKEINCEQKLGIGYYCNTGKCVK